MSIRIILVDDHKIVRSGLRTLLEQHSDMEVIAEASDGREAVKVSEQLSPDVMIIDVSMPNLNGIEATRQILAQPSKTKVIALSMHTGKRFVTGMLEAGAIGYLLKGCSFEELTTAVRAVVNNQAYLSPAVSHIVIESCVSAASPVSSPLTAREREVLQLLVEGQSAKDIGGQLFVSTKTVEAHRHNIMVKLSMHSLAELTKYAIREGITSLDD